MLQFFSPTLSGTPLALFPEQDFAWFPLENVAVVTVPLGFFFGWIVSGLDSPANRGRRRSQKTPQVTHGHGY